MSAKSLHVFVFALLVSALVTWPAPGRCADLAGAMPSVLRFGRVHAPEKHLESWPLGKNRYLPMEPEEFEGLVQRVQQVESGAPVAATIAKAEYSARLEGTCLVNGRATLHVVCPADRTCLMPLSPCGLALDRAEWLGETPEPTTLGMGEGGAARVLVTRPGRLGLEWSMSGRQLTGGVLEFSIELPACAMSHLTLDLPQDRIPFPERGVVVGSKNIPKNLRRWRIALGGHHRLKLRIGSSETAANRHHVTVMHQSMVYEVSPRGIDVSAKLRLKVDGQPLERLAVELDSGLQLAEARYGEDPVRWSVAKDEGRDTTRVELTFPEPVVGIGRELRLVALGPFVKDKAWRLPGLRPEGVFWKEGDATLLVPTPLQLKHITPLEARQTKTGPLPGPRSGEAAEFQYFGPSSGLEVVFSEAPSRMHVKLGTQIELSGSGLVGHTVAAFQVDEGEHFVLETDLGRQWIIDSVESIPGNMVDDWSMEQAGDASLEAPTPRKLTIHLAKALSSSQPLQLRIHGRQLHSPLGRVLTIKDFRPLVFSSEILDKRLVSLRAAAPYQLRLKGTERLTRIAPATLDASALSLFAETPRGFLFADDAETSRLRVTLQAQKPRYSASLRVDATVSADTLTETYRLRCVPESARVERVLVHFSRPRAKPPRWTLGSEKESYLKARFLSAPEQAAAGVSLEGETWEVLLRRPRSVPFELRASRVTAIQEARAVSLVAMPEAFESKGMVVVHAAGANRLRITNHRLTPVPPLEVPSDRYRTDRATFEYLPARDTASGSDVALNVASENEEDAVPAAWVWDTHLESRYAVDGPVHHLATYRIQNTGRERFGLRLPDSLSPKAIREIWVGTEQVAWEETKTGKGEKEQESWLWVALPPNAKFPVVSVHFLTEPASLGIASTLTSTLPDADIPMLARRWTAWLPPGYMAVGPDLRREPRRQSRPTWTQRWFGPLGRNDEEKPFDPLVARNWSALIGYEPESHEVRRMAERFLETLGSLAHQKGTKVTWGTLLTDPALQECLPVAPGTVDDPSSEVQGADGESLQTRRIVLVDRIALTRVGITPETLATLVPATTPKARGAALLREANLVLLVHPEAFLLTSTVQAALNRALLKPLPQSVLWQLTGGPHAKRLRTATSGDPTLVPVATWVREPVTPTVPWLEAPSAESGSPDIPAWSACRLELAAGTTGSVQVVHRATMRLLGWVVFFLILALAWWNRCRFSIRLIVGTGILAGLVLAVPLAYAPLASGALLGWLVYGTARLVFRKPSTTDSTSSTYSQATHASSSRTTVCQTVGTTILTAAFLLAFNGTAGGAEKSSEKPATSGFVHRVFIPVDEQQKPTGGKYYVPEMLYNALYHHAAMMEIQPRGWLLTHAVYRGGLSWATAPEGLSPMVCKAAFDLEVFAPDTPVRVPFGGEGLTVLPGSANLDGHDLQVEWDSREGVLAFTVARAGRHRLEFHFRPAVQVRDDHAGFELLVPPVPRARLELAVPGNAPVMKVPSAKGPVVLQEEPPCLVATLGPTDRLEVRWREDAGPGQKTPTLDVEELLWLKIQPGSVVLEAQYKINVVQGHVRQFRVLADPRLRLLPLEKAPFSVKEIQDTDGLPRTLQVELTEPVEDHVTVKWAFLLKESSGVGYFRLPSLEVLDARTTRRWLALSVDSSLEYQERAGKLESIAVPDFGSAWGPAETQPLLVRNLSSSNRADWVIATQPSVPRTTVDQQLVLSFGQDGILTQFDAHLATTAGYRFQYRLKTPPGLEVENISVLEGNVERAARWSETSETGLVVFLTGPVTGKHELSLRGRLPAMTPGKHPLPTMNLEQCETEKSLTTLFRRPAVLVTVDNLAGGTETEVPVPVANPAELGRLVKTFAATGSDPIRAEVFLTPNHPKMLVDQTTYLWSSEDAWEVTTMLTLLVHEGVVDEIVLSVPAEFAGPYRLDPPASLEVFEGSDASKQLLIRPQATITDRFDFRITGRLETSPGDPVSAPKIAVQHARRGRCLLVLPSRQGDRDLRWEKRHLKRIEAHEDVDKLIPSSDAPSAYEITGDHFQAVLASRSPRGEIAHVHLADVHLAWNADGTYHGVASFDVVPGGRSRCTLHFPPHCRPVQILVGGVPTTPSSRSRVAGDTAQSGTKYQVPLASGKLPQRIEMVFEGKEADWGAGRCRFQSPSLGHLPVRSALWTVSSPPLYRAREPVEALSTKPLRQEMLRLRSMVELIETASDTATTETDTVARWYHLWKNRLHASGKRLKRGLIHTDRGKLSQAAAEELPSIQELETTLAGRFGDSVNKQEAPDKTHLATDPSELWHATLERPGALTRYIVRTGDPSLVIEYARSEPGWFASRLPPALGLILALLLIVAGIRRGIWQALWFRWPHLVGVAAGIGWWLWLWPSMLGWILVAGSLISALRPGWRLRRQPDSSVVRLS